ncbi:unnamed protein product [Owenia fusiformis]|uniref:RGS domain-containing protein n=1 Tax=Owenia fusiformis TaxID=6347 RepID=A0A8S4Q7T7_OWEFU|nr:unnamed protein product [Owenia fusiformis]
MPLFRRKSDKQTSQPVVGKPGHRRSPSSSSRTSGDSVPNGDVGVMEPPLREEHGGAKPKIILHSPSGQDVTFGDLGTKDSIPMMTSSRLSKTFHEIIHDKDALPSFIQYLEAKDKVQFIKFWLDAESFQASSWSRIRTHSMNTLAKSSLSGKEKNDLDPGRSRSQGLISAIESKSHKPDDETTVPSIAVTDYDATSSTKVPKSVKVSSIQDHIPNGALNSDKITETIKSTSNDIRNISAAIMDFKPSKTKGNISNPLNAQDGEVNKTLKDCNENTSDTIKTTKDIISNTADGPAYLDLKNEDEFGQKLRKSIEKDAVNIYSKYIALDCPYPLGIGEDLRNRAIGKICREDGQIDPQCFNECQEFVLDVLEKEFYPGYKESVFHCKHQIDILTSTQVYLADVLYNEIAMSYFMEYMEQEGAMQVFECWLSIDNFQQHLATTQYDGPQAQSDSMILYEKYFSLQAVVPLGFEDKVRFEVESNICREGGPLPDCFASAKRVLLHTLNKVYFPSFMQSEIYFKYLSELINTLQSSGEMPAAIKVQSRRGSDASSDAHSIGGGSVDSDTNKGISKKNTLLAADESGSNLKKAFSRTKPDEMQMEDPVLLNPDSLWKRANQGKMCLGHVNELGQFISEFDPEPDFDKKKQKKTGKSIFKRKDKKAEEDAAWQVAQMILSEVTKSRNKLHQILDAKNHGITM